MVSQKRRFSHLFYFLTAVSPLFIQSMLLPTAQAVNFTVTSTRDAVDNDLLDGRCETDVLNECTLRAAIQQSNALPGMDNIEIPAGRYVISIPDDPNGAPGGEDQAASGDLDINDVVSITGNGDATVISGDNKYRVFDIQVRGGISLSSLVIENGVGDDIGGGGIRVSGLFGDIRSMSMWNQPIRLEKLTIRNCHANNQNVHGGAIDNPMTLDTLIVDQSLIQNNQASWGAGISSEGALIITDSQLLNNTASVDAGGIYANNGLYLDSVSINDNVSSVYGGGGISANASVAIYNSEISGNTASSGGGIHFVGSYYANEYFYMGNSTLKNNRAIDETAGSGGGVFTSASSPVDNRVIVFSACDVSNNTAGYSGGGLHINNLTQMNYMNVQNNSAGALGGGVYLGRDPITTGVTSEVKNSLFTGNQLSNNYPTTFFNTNAKGGGLYMNGDNYLVSNSTLSGNSVVATNGKADGGGLFAEITGSDVRVEFSTLFGNSSANNGADAVFLASSQLARAYAVSKTIISNSSASAMCLLGPLTGNVSDGFNIAAGLNGDNSCGFGQVNDVTTNDPVLAVLNDNGGPTFSHLPLSGAPMSGAIPHDQCQPLDQRGYARKGACSPGAIEVGGVADSRGEIVFKQPLYQVFEADANASIALTRLGGASGPLSAIVVPLSNTASTIQSTGYNPDVTDAAYWVNWADGETGDKTVDIPIINDTQYEGRETFKLALLPVDAGFTQTGMSVSTLPAALADVVIEDDDASPAALFSFTSASYSALDGQRSMYVVIQRFSEWFSSMNAEVTVSGTAVEGTDFIIDNPVVAFLPGEKQKPLLIKILDSERAEPTQITLTLKPPYNPFAQDYITQVTLPVNSAAGKSAAQFAKPSSTVTEGDAPILVTITRNGNLNSAQSLPYRIDAGSTATISDDYDLQGIHSPDAVGSITFAAGESEKTLSVTINNDNILESTEFFKLVLLKSSSNLDLGASIDHTVYIQDNDTVPAPETTVSFELSELMVNEAAGAVPIAIQRSGNLSGALSLQISLGGTATADIDYTLETKNVSFADGEGQKSILLTIVDDQSREPGETAVLSLTNVGGSTSVGFGANPQITLNISDNDSASLGFDTVNNSGGGVFWPLNILLAIFYSARRFNFFVVIKFKSVAMRPPGVTG